MDVYAYFVTILRAAKDTDHGDLEGGVLKGDSYMTTGVLTCLISLPRNLDTQGSRALT